MSFPTGLARGAVDSDEAPQVNFLLRTCQHCGVELSLGAGDILYGDTWYHGLCWKTFRTASSVAPNGILGRAEQLSGV